MSLDGPVLVVGAGLLGTSIALALRRRGVDVALRDVNPENLRIATGIGAAASNLMTGVIVERFGFNTGFLVLSAIAGLALVFFGLAMTETRPAPTGDERPTAELPVAAAT